MKKVKVKSEYDKDLLDKKASKRDRRDESGLTLLDAPPYWADAEHLWGEERQYARKIEGWEKLCIEAYFSGWVDYFDTIIQGDKIEHTIYFQWIEDIKKNASLRIYLDPGPLQSLAPPAPPLTVPKPPPPPMG